MSRSIYPKIALSQSIASLSKESQVLFLMMIPHYSVYGKMSGNPKVISGNIVPLIEYFTIPLIEKCLKEIHQKTSVKWFVDNRGLQFLHHTKWEELHKFSRRGEDHLPSYKPTADKQVKKKPVKPKPVSVAVEPAEPEKTTAVAKLKVDRFEAFWDAFDYKSGRAKALTAWNKIKMTDELFQKIMTSARNEALNRPALLARGNTPKMAQGWLTDERYNDEGLQLPPEKKSGLSEW